MDRIFGVGVTEVSMRIRSAQNLLFVFLILHCALRQGYSFQTRTGNSKPDEIQAKVGEKEEGEEDE